MAVKGFRRAMVVILLGLTSTWVTSCKQEQEEKVLSRQEVVKFLQEVYLAESKINQLSLNSDSAKKVFEIMLPKIAEKTGISDSLVRRSLDYYSRRPEDMQQIYTALVDSLNLKEQQVVVEKD